MLAFMASLTLLAASGATALPVEQPEAEKKICKSQRMTGSLTRKTRVCLTGAEWDRLRKGTKQDIDAIQRNSGAIPRQQAGPGAPAGAG